MTTNESKKSGIASCLLGCLTVVVICCLGVAGVVFYLFRFGPMAAATQVDTLAHLGGGPAIALRVDAEAPGAFSLGMLNDPGLEAYNGAILRMVRPYELTVQLEPAADASVVGIGGAISMPRGANVLLSMLAEARKSFEKNGREVSVLEVDREKNGLLVGHGVLPLPSEAGALRGEAWPAPEPGDPPVTEGGHFIEFTMDNRTGAGGLAMTALAQALSELDESKGASPLSLLSQVRLIKGSHMARTAWVALDFSPAGDLTVKYRVSALNEVCAQLIAGGLAQIPHELTKQLGEMEAGAVPLQVSPSQTLAGTEIQGEIMIVGIASAARTALVDFNENRGDDPFGFLPMPDTTPPQMNFSLPKADEPLGNGANGS